MNNPKTIADKIIAAILSTDPSKPVTYDMIIDRYSTRVDSRGVLDNAIVLVHKSKKITVKDVKGVLTYSSRIEELVLTPDYATYCKDNYPYPLKCKHCVGKLCALCFPFYNPEQDTIPKIKERLYMTRDEYKAASQGKTFIARKKAYEHIK